MKKRKKCPVNTEVFQPTLRDRITEIGCLPEVISTTTSKNLKIEKIAT